MKSDFLIAVTQLAAERHLPREAVISAIEAALASAYKKDSVLPGQEISVSLNPANGELKLFTHRIAVQKVEDPEREISLTEAKKIQANAVLGDDIAVESDIQNTGRIAAQTAKQVVLQRLREAELELVFEEYAEKEGDIVTGTVQRSDPRQVTLDLGRTEAILPLSEQVPTERYRPGQKLKVHVVEVRRSIRGPEIIVSRTSKDLLRRLFEMEVPEIFKGIVEIKAIAREAGSRSKVAVFSRQERVDPVGSCVGLRGIRIQNIVNELQGEKIDVIQWHPNPEVFLANALSPCPVTRVELGPEANAATVVVPDRQLSLAIGREGQNARLCAKLSGLMVNIKSATEAEEERVQRAARPVQQLVDVADIAQPSAEEETLTVEASLATETEAGVEPALEPQTVLSIEEQLAEAAVEITPAPAVAADIAAIPDTVWSVPKVAQQPRRVRFAEDIMAPRAEPAPETTPRRRGKQPRGARAGAEETAPRSAKRSRRDEYPLDDEADPDEDQAIDQFIDMDEDSEDMAP
ncbi:MAG: transcription termination factor NusA [Chloroflexi bacterium]|nr:transcription termination factor NusA [Chloroflexota bacterium]